MFTGIKYPYFAKYNESTGEYSDGFLANAAVELGTTPSFNSASVPGDDVIVKKIDKFKESAVAVKVTTMPIVAASTVFGHTVTGTEIKMNGNDKPNYVGFGCLTTKVNDATDDTFTAIIIPKVKFMDGPETFTTNGDSITINPEAIAGTALTDINGDWLIKKTFDTEAEALTYVKTTLEILDKCTTPIASVPAGTYATAKSVTLTAGAGETIKYTINGLTPSATVGTTYSAAISVADDTMIRAIAIKSGFENSDIANYEYIITA